MFRAPRSKLKVECRIYQARVIMFKYAKKLIGNTYPNLTKNTVAYAEGTIRLIPKGHLAVVFFNRNGLSYGTIAHEMDHVANCLLARRGVKTIECSLDMATDGEEQHADILEELVDSFHKKYGP